MICFCVHKLSIIGGQRFYVQKYPHFGSRTCGWCEYKRKIVGLTVAAHQTPTMPPPPCAQESCPYVSHSFRCCAFLINGLLCWGRIASQPFQVDPGRVLVGGGHHDHRRLRGHDVGPSPACWSHDLFFSSVMSQETHTLTFTHHLSMSLHHLLLCFSCQQQKCMTAVFN